MKNKKIVIKKHIILVIILVFLFLIFLYFYLRKTNYELEYYIEDIKIIEKYDKNYEAYYFYIEYENKTYELVALDDYSTKRKLIKDIEITNNDNETCLNFNAPDIKLYDICSNSDEYYLDNIDNQDQFNSQETYQNINIDTMDNKTYLLWNYHDFIYLNNDTEKTINLFSNDIYNLSLIYAYDNNLLIPDYEQNYFFDKLYVIDANNANISSIDLRFDVYFDSYFLGNDDNNIYLYDLKESQEFYIDLNKKEIYKSNNEILVNGNWENVSSQTFQREKPTFSEMKNMDITLQDGTIYLQIPDGKTKIALTSRMVSTLVKVDGFNIYYISGDILYKYNPYDGERALLQYSEWNFNYQNMVFIFD